MTKHITEKTNAANDSGFEAQFPALTGQARGITVSTEEEFQFAADLLKQIKSVQKNVIEHYGPMKKQAKATHKTICDEEKRYLNPLCESETDIKTKMAAYAQEQEARAQIKSAELKARQEDHAAEQLERAEELRAQGDAIGAAIAEQSAYLMDALQTQPITAGAKASGIGYQKDYIVEITDEEAVPVSIAGITIRPVDLAAVKRLAKTAKGKLTIPGIRITETKIVKART